MKTITIFILFTFLTLPSLANKALLPRAFLLNGIEEHYVNELIYLNETVKLDEIEFCSFTFKPFKSCRAINAKFLILVPIHETTLKNQTYGVEYIDGAMVERELSNYEKLFIDKVLKYFNQITNKYKKNSSTLNKIQQKLESDNSRKVVSKENVDQH